MYMNRRDLTAARESLAKGLEFWKKVDNRNNIYYLITIKYKCVMHVNSREEMVALSTAEQYLKQYPPTD